MSSTQLIDTSNYNTNNIRFSAPILGGIPDSKPAINYKRINISTIHPDGSSGDLLMATSKVYSYGVSENTNQDTGKVNGFVMPLVLYDRNGPTQEQRDFVTTFNAIVEYCKKFIYENKEELEQYDLELTDLKKMNPLYYKKEKGKIIDGSAPTLYAKLIVSKKQGDKIITVFYDENDDGINALDLLTKHCYARGVIKFESIFVGNKISIQVKLYECQVALIDFGHKRLLQRPSTDSRVSNEIKNSVPMTLSKSNVDDDDDDDIGSLVGDDENKDDEDFDIPVEDTIKTIPKKTIKKVIKKVQK